MWQSCYSENIHFGALLAGAIFLSPHFPGNMTCKSAMENMLDNRNVINFLSLLIYVRECRIQVFLGTLSEQFIQAPAIIYLAQ